MREIKTIFFLNSRFTTALVYFLLSMIITMSMFSFLIISSATENGDQLTEYNMNDPISNNTTTITAPTGSGDDIENKASRSDYTIQTTNTSYERRQSHRTYVQATIIEKPDGDMIRTSSKDE